MKKTILIMLTAISTSATAMAQTAATTDEQAIQKIISSMESNWVQKNGAGFATVFADQHDFIVWNGYYFPNQSRENNARAHQGLFDGPYRTYDIKLKIDKIRFIRPDLALVHVLGAGYRKGTPVPENPGVLMSMIPLPVTSMAVYGGDGSTIAGSRISISGSGAGWLNLL